MENRIINIATVAEVANALKELNNQMVFVGGAVVSLYTDDPSADEIRPTGDIIPFFIFTFIFYLAIFKY